MEFTVLLSDLQKVLQKVLPAVPPKSTVPVLEHLYFKLDGNRLQIIATDQNITIVANTEVISETAGAILVPARMLNEIIKALGTVGSIKFETNLENFEVKIISAKGTYEMKGLDPDDYIDIPQLFDTEAAFDEAEGVVSSMHNRAEFTREQIVRLADKTIFSVSTDEYRIAMTGVFFQFRETFVNAVATDSFRLSKCTVNSDKPIFPQNFDLLLPAKAVEILKKVDSDVIMTTIENYGKITHARFDMENSTFMTRVIDEKFPPYESVLPKGNELLLTADLNEFITALKRVSLFSNEKSRQVRFFIESNQIKVFAEDEETGKHGHEIISCEFNRPEFSIAFNYKFVLDALENIDTKDTQDNIFNMSFSEPNRPALITPKSDANELLMLVMPVRITA
ncbi:MAG: DNA polymerase III subunit beta [Candidatus Kapabacteria bacterium]|nr:DNA polymerase III subunit beta [Ignavibacteriota bacterium]MCW5885845.1 DNA polymerase III subunit beta [Candidatus Kapabacteria bacterium]